MRGSALAGAVALQQFDLEQVQRLDIGQAQADRGVERRHCFSSSRACAGDRRAGNRGCAASRRGCGRRSPRAAPCPRPARHSARRSPCRTWRAPSPDCRAWSGRTARPRASRLQHRRCRRAPAAPLPTPYQPGSITRACAQLNTQGMARRSSIRSDLVRLAGREPILSSAISAIGVIWRKKARKPSVS